MICVHIYIHVRLSHAAPALNGIRAATGPGLLVYLLADVPSTGAELRRLTAERFPPRRAGATQDTRPLDVDEARQGEGGIPWKQRCCMEGNKRWGVGW